MKHSEKDYILISQFDRCLSELRESLHRWGKLSSRNEAIEELSKLLLAQIRLVTSGHDGLEVFSRKVKNEKSSSIVHEKINVAILSSIPDTLSKNLPREEFLLKIRRNEYRFIEEICTAFSLVDWSDIKNFANLDLFNESFGKFLTDSFSEEKQLGQYLTPTEVVKLIVSTAINKLSSSELDTLTHPKNCKHFGYILDPSCGVGSFIIELVHQLLPVVKSKHGANSVNVWLNNLGKHVFVAIDKSNRMIKIAATNLAALGIRCDHLYSMNSLDSIENNDVLNKLLNRNVKIILTNPPFGAEFKDSDIKGYKIATDWATSIPKKIDSELLFFERYVDWLAPKGQCIAVMPDSILTNRGLFYDLRKGLSNEINLHTIVSLPTETFAAAGTTTKTSIIHFSKEVVEYSNVYFANCKNIGFKVITKSNLKQKVKTNNCDLPLILEEICNKSKVTFGKRTVIKKEFTRWDANFHASLSEIELKKIGNSENQVRVRDVAQLINERFDPRKSDSLFRYIEISDVSSERGVVHSKLIEAKEAPSRARKLVRFGDVLVSTVRPEQKKIGVVINPVDDGAVCTTGLAVLRPGKIDPFLLSMLLRTDFVTNQIAKHNIGIAYPVVDEGCFMDLLLPLSLLELQKFSSHSSEIIQLESELLKKRAVLTKRLTLSMSQWMDA